MRCTTFKIFASLALGATAFAGDNDKKTITPPEEDSWKFKLSMPGWLAGVDGDTGINGLVTHVSANPGDIIRRIDMTASFRGEASKGRFGIMADFLYLSLSDGLGTNTVVKKLDVQFDQTMADLGVRWRLIDHPRGSLDLLAGVRYTNLFQQLVVQPNAERIDEASTRLVDDVSGALGGALGEKELGRLIARNLVDRIDDRFTGSGGGTAAPLPVGPLGGRLGEVLRARIQEIIDAKRAELAAALLARAQAIGAAAQAAAQERLDEVQRDLSRKIAKAVESKLDTRVARTDDWWDPYIGLRASYHFTDRLYVTAKGDIGGFGVGSDFTWQANAALGLQLTQSMFAEIGYRALGVQYDHDGLSMDTITHGAEINLGIAF